ncbi:MAG: hypothetical protein N4A72_00050 [Bacteroidales bacterium]|jgi:hypothetical protein|nr:hypothetical protein [Bacteroidales bacterium]
MELYQLGEYNARTDLSEQASRIRDIVKTTFDYQIITSFVNQFEILEETSVIILKKAILAGYWTSYYGFGWSKEQEISFWELVYEKREPKGTVPILTLAESYRGNEIKTLKEVIDLYWDAIALEPQHYYSLSQEGGDELDVLMKNPSFFKKCLLIEFDINENINNYSIEEVEEEKPYLLKRCNGNKELESFIETEVKKLIERIKVSNKI